MNAIELIDSFSEFKELKNIDRVTMMRIVEDVFRSTLKRKYGLQLYPFRTATDG